MSKADDLHIERLSDANLHLLDVLHTTVYEREAPSKYFQKKYDTAFTGVKYTGFFALDYKGIPAAFYGVIPCFLQVEGKKVLSAQSADTMTHPHYRNLGLFTKLANLTYELCVANDINLIFGFPNQNSFPGFVNKLGWQHIDTLSCFIIPVEGLAWGGWMRKFAITTSFYEKYLSKQLGKYQTGQKGIVNSVIADGFDGVYRDWEYFNYKSYSPAQVIHLPQGQVWLKLKDDVTIGDIDLASDDIDGMIAALIKLASEAGLKQLMIQLSAGTRLHQLFNECYHAVPAFPVIVKDMGSGVDISRLKFTMADIDIF